MRVEVNNWQELYEVALQQRIEAIKRNEEAKQNIALRDGNINTNPIRSNNPAIKG